MAGRPASSPYLVKSHQKVKLSHFPTADTGQYRNKEEAAVDLERHRQRLTERLADKDKHWKLSEADFAERGYWPQYVKAYQDAIEHTSRKHAPWFIIPADHKWYRNVAISEILVDAISRLKMNYPKPNFDPSKIKL